MFQAIGKLPRWLVIELIIPLTILNGWVLFLAFRFFQPFITIFVVATLLSFLLDYPIQLWQQRGLSRGYAIAGIILVTFSIVTICGFTLVPLLLNQLSTLANLLPVWLDSGDRQFEALDNWFAAQNIPLDLSAIAAQLSHLLPDELKVLPNQILNLVLGAADRVIEVILTVVLTIYLLLHGEEFWHSILQWLPNKWSEHLRQSLREQFRNYFIGQATIASLMALVLTIAFFLLKIPFWLVFGLGIGITVLIPFGDLLSISAVSILVSFKSIWLGGKVLAIAILADQIIDNAVAPRILSRLVGLNPIWVLIALLVGAQLGGILGVLIAVPTAATIKNIFVMAKASSDLSIRGKSSEKLQGE
jgi:predicted PurR-regulated permease PerM